MRSAITAIAHPPTPLDERLQDTRPLSLLGLMDLHRRSLVLLVLLGLVAGLGVAYLSPVTYTAQGQMLAGATSVNAAAVPSFTQAGQSLAQTYSRVFSGDQVQRAMVAHGYDPATESVTASPIAGSSVILVEAEAPTARAASRAVDAGIDALASTVSALLDNSTAVTATRTTLQTAYRQQLQAQASIDALERKRARTTSTDYEQATADLGAAQATVAAARQLLADQVAASVQSNGARRLTSAHVTSSTSTQRYELRGAIGLIAGFVVWLLIALLRSRPLRRKALPARRTAG
jgi:hypothetical protein